MMTYQRVEESRVHSEKSAVTDAMPLSFRGTKIDNFRPSKPEGVSRPQGTKIPPPPTKKTA